jgi:hypothetical protein
MQSTALKIESIDKYFTADLVCKGLLTYDHFFYSRRSADKRVGVARVSAISLAGGLSANFTIVVTIWFAEQLFIGPCAVWRVSILSLGRS